MKGIAKIKGSLNPKIGEDSFYEVVEFHKGTPMPNPNSVKWKLFKKNNGKWEEAKGNSKTGMKVAFNFSPRSYGKEVLVEAYLFEPEMKSPPGLVVKPVLGPRKIVNTEILNANGDKITKTPKYGQSITLKVTTQNMPGEKLNLSLWERDTLKDSGHDPKGNTRLWSGQSKTIDLKGVVEEKIMLTLAMKSDANKSLFDGSEHEYYLLAEATGMKTISTTTLVSIEEVPTTPAKKTDEKPKEAKPIAKQTPVKIKNAVGADKIKADDSNKVVKVTPTEKVEGIIAAYFAKEEYTIKTDEKVGTQYYRFKNEQKKGFDKERTAVIIMEKVTALVKADKKYVKTEDIKKALVEKSYKKDDPISFNLYKLGANFIRVNSAPLEEEVYVVANTYLLNGKEVTIKIKEKEAVLVDANADVMVLEAKENGAEITTLKATVDNGIAKVKIKLRPKEDEDLKKWKEKLANGIKDGTHKYTVKNTFTVSGDLDKIASSIEKKSNEALAPKHTVKKADISALLAEGATYPAGTSLEFPKYKKAEEMLWLKAECQGDIKKYEGEYLKKDGEYFVVGKKCECEEKIRAFMRMLRVGEGTGEIIKSRDKKTKEIIYITHDFEKGYTTAFGGNVISDLSDHPRINYGGSTASGAYQVMGYTWDDATFSAKRKEYNIGSFSKENQDKFAIVLLKYHPGCSELINLIISNQTEKGIRNCASRIWASLPEKGDNSRYLFKGEPQPVTPMKTVLEHYEQFLKEELAGNSPIHLKEGFLKDFDIKCNCGKNSALDGKWHDPVDEPMSTNYYQNGGIDSISKIWGLFGDDIRQEVSRKHTGLDLFAKRGTNIYACVDGTIYNRRWHSGYGNTITIKVKDPKAFMDRKRTDYTKKTNREMDNGTSWDDSGDIYLFYAHLHSVNEFVFGQEVKSGDILGTTGRSGVTGGTHAPHLHFEILCSYNMGVGTNYRINPAYFVNYKYFDEQSDSDRSAQLNEKNEGQIVEVNGSEQLSTNNLF